MSNMQKEDIIVEEKKCDFCGTSKVREEAGINKVKYKFPHPNGGRTMFACHDCTNYMIYLWGRGFMRVNILDESVQVDKTYFCKMGKHSMCGGLDCNCNCH